MTEVVISASGIKSISSSGTESQRTWTGKASVSKMESYMTGELCYGGGGKFCRGTF